MKKTLSMISLSCMIWLLPSCSDDFNNTLRPPESFTFGTFKAGCTEDCVTIYFMDMENHVLYKSVDPRYPVYELDSLPYGGEFISVHQQKYKLSKNLKASLPHIFLAEIPLVFSHRRHSKVGRNGDLSGRRPGGIRLQALSSY